MITTQLTRIEGEIRTSSSVLQDFQKLLDKTYDILVNTNKEAYQGIPMWLFEVYSELSNLKENKELYAPEKYEEVQKMKTNLYQEIIAQLGMEQTREIFNMNLTVNNERNDHHLAMPLLRIA